MALPTSPRISTADEFVSQRFDFIVVGGGTAGLVVAARLAQASPALNVGVLEAGVVAHGEQNIDIPGFYGRSLGSRFDWGFVTEPQSGLDGRKVPWARGKVLGGSSALNFMTWTRAHKSDYDAWEALGNKGWAWDDLLPFFKKSETFQPPSSALQDERDILPNDYGVLGTSGPICVSKTPLGPTNHLWHHTLNALGVETNRCHLGGSNVGVWTDLHAIDPTTHRRCYSTAYCHDQPPNLHILTEATAQEILLQPHGHEYQATGVRFTCQGKEHVISASREVILSAGGIMCPQLLELSGIGNPDVLSKAGVPVKVNSPMVGENLQDHMLVEYIFEVDESLENPDDFKQSKPMENAALEKYHKTQSGPLTVMPSSMAYIPLSHFMPSDRLADVRTRVSNMPAFDVDKRQILQARLDGTAKLGQMEYIFDLGNWSPFFQGQPGKKYGSLIQLLQYPNSVGSIHVRPDASGKTSADVAPAIDAGYYNGANGLIDLEIMVQSAQFAKRIVATQPLAGIIKEAVYPPAAAFDDASKLKQWMVDSTSTDWHSVGTCGMGGRAGIRGGVVDERLRVYGVRGLRVADGGIMPLHISTHPQATIYAIGEKAAHMILEDMGKV